VFYAMGFLPLATAPIFGLGAWWSDRQASVGRWVLAFLALSAAVLVVATLAALDHRVAGVAVGPVVGTMVGVGVATLALYVVYFGAGALVGWLTAKRAPVVRGVALAAAWLLLLVPGLLVCLMANIKVVAATECPPGARECPL
jgi:hypothetical protein